MLKVYPCEDGNESPTRHFCLNWDEIIKNKGIYQPDPKYWPGDARVIVYEVGEAFYLNNNRTQIEKCKGVQTSKFRKMDEVLCMSVKYWTWAEPCFRTT